MASSAANTSKRKAAPTPVPVQDEGDIMRMTPLGAGQEVGRSCLLLEYKGKTIMLDCGLHPAYSGLSALPFFDDVDPSTIDVLLITHFHVDHAAALPYFMEKTTFKGRVFMTHPTKAIYKWLLSDYVKISNLSAEDQLYDEQDLMRSYEKIEVVDYHQEVDVEGIRFTPYNAGHVLGAAMFLIEIAGVRVLYTGDYSREEDRHLMAAEKPPNVTPEVLICESTYGVQSHEPRVDREARFTRMVHDVVHRGGRCLLPVFALGRAQELLLILDEYWQAHPELHTVPIYYASSLAKKCMTVFQTYTNMMNARIRQQVKISNPFQFKHISNLKSMAHFDDVGPCVMMASPGMLQNGLSRELLELWCVDKRNGVIIPGYVVEGTLGKQILSQPEEIASMNGAKLPLRLTVEYISFSAHVDYRENSAFIEAVGASNLVLVHGDSNEMGRLKSALQSKYAEREVPLHIHTPKNCETVELYFRGEKMAKTIGHLAAHPPTNAAPLTGLLVCRDFMYHLLDPKDLPEFTDLVPASLTQRQTVPCHAPFGIVKWYLENMYGPVDVLGKRSFVVFDTVKVTQAPNLRTYTLEWEGDAVNDMIADSVVAVIVREAGVSMASVKLTKSDCPHQHGHPAKDDEELLGDDFKIEVDKKVLDSEEQSPPSSAPSESDAHAGLRTLPSGCEAAAIHTTKLLALHFGNKAVARVALSDVAEEQKCQECTVAAWTVKVEEELCIARVTYSLDGLIWRTVVSAPNDEIKRRVQVVIDRAWRTARPIHETWRLSDTKFNRERQKDIDDGEKDALQKQDDGPAEKGGVKSPS
ncbi:Cleavage and polyadenylation specificity factor subunit 3 [Geranomyces variabilis]|nr:Cleavage and polyadenylation specificity factor subunit 3 [Geranomyces variabilis]